jgi:UDPglucose 6-dehydrogenase
LIGEAAGGALEGARIAVLGAAFKPDTDDVRDSPALDVARRLAGRGARVRVYDPEAGAVLSRAAEPFAVASDAAGAARDADVLAVLTEWREFSDLDPAALSGLVARQAVVDGRNALDPGRWRGAGWDYRGIGAR